MTDGQLNANVDQYLHAAAANTPPPTILSDPVVPGVTPVEQWLAVLTAAANLSDATDNAQAVAEHAERDAKMREAAEKFATQDEQAAAELESIAAQPYTFSDETGFSGGQAPAQEQNAAMAQQLPQMASGLAGVVAGAVGGVLQPLAQLPQQAAQAVQQAMQAGMGLLQHAGSGDADLSLDDADLAATPLAEDFGIDADDFSAPGGAGGGALDIGSGGISGGGGGLGPLSVTAPTGYLGPPPVPPSSVSTAPSSAPITSITPPGNAVSHPPVGTGMAGMPLIPPGAMGAAAGTDKDDKTDTKRVSVPPVRNGAPVQGRLTVPPEAPAVTKKLDGKPVVARRIIGPADSESGETKFGS